VVVFTNEVERQVLKETNVARDSTIIILPNLTFSRSSKAGVTLMAYKLDRYPIEVKTMQTSPKFLINPLIT